MACNFKSQLRLRSHSCAFTVLQASGLKSRAIDIIWQGGCSYISHHKCMTHNTHRKSFIEAELAKRLGGSKAAGGPGLVVEGAEARRKRMEAELYQVPQELQVCVCVCVSASRSKS